ncbi:tail fiber protein [Phytobacter ursingii]|uniref:tail fiber protein n=1 Tax=Phytobacter ursingii TaxID=1972431 RepID=UPI0037433F85
MPAGDTIYTSSGVWRNHSSRCTPCHSQWVILTCSFPGLAFRHLFYGGDGVTTFNLPNLHGRMPIGFGQLNTVIHNISDTGGTDKVQLTPILINWLRDTTPIYPQLNLVPHT